MTPQELMRGACDIHLHSGPALVTRSVDHVEVCRLAVEAGMRAIVIKDQHVPCANVAQIVQKYFVKEGENFNIYGSVITGNTQGGLNPSVVEAAIAYGAKIVWMPVLAARYHREQSALMSGAATATMPKPQHPLKYNPAMTVIDEQGKLYPAISDICKLVADADIVLATGHLNPETEIRPLLDEAVKQGVKKIVVTHPEYFNDTSLKRMREYTDAGFYVEHILTTLYSGKQTYDRLFTLINNNGDNVIVSSDMGQPNRPTPVQALQDFIAAMQQRGMSDQRIRQITSVNQRRLLNIEPLEENETKRV